MEIPFNRPHFTGREALHLSEAAIFGHLAGNGHYTRLCQEFFEERYGFRKSLLTTSCTDALELGRTLAGDGPDKALFLGEVPGHQHLVVLEQLAHALDRRRFWVDQFRVIGEFAFNLLA